jgi:3-hydroxyisobutyrate dehydrogenase-like beta-hydroxyacid dehydrogenase
MMSSHPGELDNLISSLPHARFITCPIFGAPAVAAKGLLIAVMSGDYRSKKEVAYHLVPAVARKIIDLGGNVEKGSCIHFLPQVSLNVRTSSDVQAYWKFFDSWDHGGHGRVFDTRRKGRG